MRTFFHQQQQLSHWIITCSVGNLYYVSFFKAWLVGTIPRTTFPPRKTQQKRCDTLFPTLLSFTVNKNQQIGNLIIPTSPVGFTQHVSTQLFLVVLYDPDPGPGPTKMLPHQTNPDATEDAAKSVAVPEQNGWIWWPKAPVSLLVPTCRLHGNLMLLIPHTFGEKKFVGMCDMIITLEAGGPAAEKWHS